MNRVDASGTITGRYALYGPIARGGMATVFFGRLRGPAGFARTVAIKRLHPQFAAEPEFVSMFVEEARLATRFQSPHVVSTLDVVASGQEVFLVMDYVAGESLARLARAATDRGERIPIPVTIAILSGVLQGLHAAHEARSENGEPLGIVHRDVSPQNIIVGTDGLARVLDFGVAKAAGRLQNTRDGELKGKLSYMPAEQLRRESLTRRADIYSASVVLWETLTGERLFAGDDEGGIVTRVLLGKVEPPSRVLIQGATGARGMRAIDELERGSLEALDPIVLRGLDRDASKRFETAGEMALALERCVPPATARGVSEWVERVAGSVLAERAARVSEIESGRASGEVVPLAGEEEETRVEVPTQVAVSQVAIPSAAIPRRSWGARLGWIGAIALLTGTGAIGFWIRPHGTASSTPPPVVLPTAATPATAAPEVLSSALPLPSAAATPTTTTTPDAAPSSPTTAPASHGGAGAPRKARPTNECNPPFSWDAQGKKHYKAQCL